MKSNQKEIASVHVDYDLLYKTCPPQFDVTITFTDKSVLRRVMFDKDIQEEYGQFLNSNEGRFKQSKNDNRQGSRMFDKKQNIKEEKENQFFNSSPSKRK